METLGRTRKTFHHDKNDFRLSETSEWSAWMRPGQLHAYLCLINNQEILKAGKNSAIARANIRSPIKFLSRHVTHGMWAE